MKIVFFSSFISPHVKPFCDCLSQQCDFTYVQTMQLSEERRKMGYAYEEPIPYLIDLSTDKVKQKKMADEADCVIINSGSADLRIVENRIRQDKVTFFCNERLFKKGAIKYADPRLWKQWQINLMARGKRTYLLCMGKYVSRDFEKIGFEKRKSFKFGYFPHVVCGEPYQVSDIIRLLWVGRMINWKQPEKMIDVVEKLEERNVSYVLNMVGDGPFREKVKVRCSQLTHPEKVILHNMLPNEQVRLLMAQADALVITSNRQEGWGAVANEALGTGTPVVAFNTIGAADYLIQDGINGQLCKENDLIQLTEAILKIKKNSVSYRKNAFQTIEKWNATVAAERFLHVCESCVKDGKVVFYDCDVMSMA